MRSYVCTQHNQANSKRQKKTAGIIICFQVRTKQRALKKDNVIDINIIYILYIDNSIEQWQAKCLQ